MPYSSEYETAETARMKLIGRRLPDLMIGILIVVLALGLGSLLLTQRNRTAQAPSLPPAASEPATDIPAAPGTADTAPSAALPPATAITPPASGNPATTADPATTVPSAVPTPTGPTPTGSVAAPTTPQPDTSAPPVTTTAPSSTPPGTSSGAAATPPRSGGAVATSERRTPLKRDYRISLGTFGSVAEASASTAAVQALGYTVYPIDLGSQVVAQVGPFADSAAANAALSDISRAYGSAMVYAPRQSATGSASRAPAPVAPAPAPASSSAAPGTPAPAAPGFSARRRCPANHCCANHCRASHPWASHRRAGHAPGGAGYTHFAEQRSPCRHAQTQRGGAC